MEGFTTVNRHQFLKAALGTVVALFGSSFIPHASNRADAAEQSAADSQQPSPRDPATSSEPLRVDVTVDGAESTQVMALLEQVGAQKVEKLQQRGLTGIETVLAAIIVASALSNLIIKLLPLWKCGVIVDARGSRVLTQKSCDLGRGTVLVVKSDGTETKLHEPSQVQMEAVLASLTK